MKLALLLVGAQLVACQYGPLPARKISRPLPDSINEIEPQDNPSDHGLNGLPPGVHPLNKATSFWWSGPNSPFRPQGVVPLSPQPDNRPASGCPPGGCGANPSSQVPVNPGSGSFLGQGYGPHPGKPPAGGNQQTPDVIPPQSSSQTINKPIDISSNPFLSSALQKPIPSSQDTCQSQDTFCVPSNFCYNGLITDNDPNLAYKYKKGPCTGNELCCRTNYLQSSGGSFPSSSNFPGGQTGSNIPDGSATKYTGPLNTTPPPGCAAALKCVAEIYCTAEGVMSDTPVQLTREQLENKVPLSDCQDLDSGLIGKCCRDPNYKDPWPAGMMMAKGQGQFDDGLYKGNQNFDDGQYRPEHQAPILPVILKPQPGQTHSQVFPQNEDKLAGSNPGQVLLQPGQSGFTTAGQSSTVFQSSYAPGRRQPNFSGSAVSFHQGPNAGSPQQFPGQSVPQHSQSGLNTQPGVFPVSPGVNTQIGSNVPQQLPGQFLPNAQPGSVAQHPQLGSPSAPQFGSPQQSIPNTPSYGSSTGQKQFPPPFPGSPSSTPQQIPQVNPGQECGVRRPPFTDNVDINSANGEFPWQAIVISSKNNSALCSGAIISDNAILTSAHCLEGFDANDLQVKVGTWRLNEPGNEQVSKVAAIVPHPSFDSGSLAKDQAVLALEQPLVFNQNVDKVCLPPADKEHYTQDGKTCYITGWGRPNLQGGLPGTILHKMEVNLIPNNQCENTLKQTYLGKYFILNEGFTCALPKYGGEFCKVDVGSPLVCDRGDGHYELAGIYSWDTQCSSQAPAVLAECDSQWTQQVLNTPVDTLIAQQYRPKFETSRPEDIDRKPGFALGYGK